jgi:uncharacterized membrane protein YhaH (DUF805 family)
MAGLKGRESDTAESQELRAMRKGRLSIKSFEAVILFFTIVIVLFETYAKVVELWVYSGTKMSSIPFGDLMFNSANGIVYILLLAGLFILVLMMALPSRKMIKANGF